MYEDGCNGLEWSNDGRVGVIVLCTKMIVLNLGDKCVSEFERRQSGREAQTSPMSVLLDYCIPDSLCTRSSTY